MKLSKHLYLLTVCFFVAATSLASAEKKEEENPLKKLNWITGPGKASMKSIAEIDVPKDFVFTDGKGTQKLMEAMGNLTSGEELGFLSPASFLTSSSTSSVWFAVFEFSDEGYIKDDDKDKLDADKMLKTIKEGAEQSNKERTRRGLPTMKVVDWEKKPHYDEKTHNLEWAVRFESQGEPIVNYNTRILGRKGVMTVDLVVEPDKLSATLPEFEKVMATYSFKSGERYAEYKQGDKIAKYGLAALITGGAVAVAAKTGLLTAALLFFKKAWKLVVIGVVAIGSFFKRLIFGRDKSES